MDTAIKIAAAILVIILLGLLISLPVMFLWNHCLVGTIDGVHPIGFLKSWGLLTLCGLLFKTNLSLKND